MSDLPKKKPKKPTVQEDTEQPPPPSLTFQNKSNNDKASKENADDESLDGNKTGKNVQSTTEAKKSAKALRLSSKQSISGAQGTNIDSALAAAPNKTSRDDMADAKKSAKALRLSLKQSSSGAQGTNLDSVLVAAPNKTSRDDMADAKKSAKALRLLSKQSISGTQGTNLDSALVVAPNKTSRDDMADAKKSAKALRLSLKQSSSGAQGTNLDSVLVAAPNKTSRDDMADAKKSAKALRLSSKQSISGTQGTNLDSVLVASPNKTSSDEVVEDVHQDEMILGVIDDSNIVDLVSVGKLDEHNGTPHTERSSGELSILDRKRFIADRSNTFRSTRRELKNASAFADDGPEQPSLQREEERMSDSNIQPGAFAVAGLEDSSDSSFNVVSYAEETHDDLVEETQDNDYLVNAMLVDEKAIPEAEAVSEETLLRQKQRNARCIMIGLIVIVATIVTSVVLTRNKSSQPTASQSPNPTSTPSSSPSQSPTTSLRAFLEGVTPGSIDAFDIENSPQARALSWLENNHTDVYQYSDARKVQRFVLATFYFSMSGDKWIDSADWLSPKDECEWFSSTTPEFLRCSKGSFGEEALFKLTLDFNRLKGTIPPEIHLLSTLRVLDLSSNVITGSLPSELGLMSTLQQIVLNGNSLGGTLSTELGLVHENLDLLDLSSNNIEGSLSSSLFSLTNLKSLDFSDNILTGTLTNEMGKLSKLTFLSLSENTLSGSIPSEILSLEELEHFTIHENVLSGSLPDSTSYNSSKVFPKLKEFKAMTNFISGQLPSSIGFMAELELLDMSNNRFTGTIISEIGKLSQLETLNLHENTALSGPLPLELFALQNLETLDLSMNSHSGQIPDNALESLEILNLKYNNLSGSIPGNIHLYKKLKTLDLSHNEKISGELPETMGSLVNLEYLLLGYNEITGSIPTQVGLLTNFEQIWLHENQLVGSIPTEVGLLTRLDYLRLRTNKLTGALPTEVGLLSNLENLYLNENDMTGVIPTEFGLLTRLELANFRDNSFTGTIPSECGLLSNLGTLFMDKNFVEGEFSSEICDLRRNLGISLLSYDCDRIFCPCCFDTCKDLDTLQNPSIATAVEPIVCAEGTIPLQVVIGTDKEPEGVEWDVTDESSGEVLLQGGPLTASDRLRIVVEERCIPKDTCTVFTSRGLNDEGYRGYTGQNGDYFLIKLNESVILNGNFFLTEGRTSNGVLIGETCAIESRACSLEHTCSGDDDADSSEFFCTMENDDNVPLSGYCEPPCGLCKDGRAPPYGDLVIIPQSNTTCSERHSQILEQKLIREECDAEQGIYGVICGCDNNPTMASVTSTLEKPETGLCRLCPESGTIPDFPSRIVLNKLTCLEMEHFITTRPVFDCDEAVNDYSLWCCRPPCSSSEACEPGSFCNFENGNNGFCEFCGEPSSSTCELNSDLTLEGIASCQATCAPLECDSGYSSIRLDLNTGRHHKYVSWTMADFVTDNVILQDGNGPEYLKLSNFTYETCIASDACLRFTIQDLSGGSGLGAPGHYQLYLDQVLVTTSAEQGPFEVEQTLLIGDCSPTMSPTGTPFRECEEGFVSMRLILNLDEYPEDTSWDVVDSAGAVIVQRGGYTEPNNSHDTCIPSGDCLLFTIYDEYGDGFPGGDFTIYINEEVHVFVDDFDDGDMKRIPIGDCPDTDSPTTSPSISTRPTLTPTVSGIPTSSPSSGPTMTPSVSESPTSLPSSAPTLSPVVSTMEPTEYSCVNDGKVNFTIEMTIQKDPEDITWAILGEDNENTVLAQGGPYVTNNNDPGEDDGGSTVVVESVCLPLDFCVVFQLQDSNDNVGGEESSSSSSFSSVELLATANIYLNNAPIGITTYFGYPTRSSYGQCDPIQ